MVKRVHAPRGLVDPAGERDRALEDGLQELLVLNAGSRVLVLDDQRRIRDVEIEEFPRGQLMVQPIDRPVLQVAKWIVLRSPRELVLGDGGLLLPGIGVVSGVRRRLPVLPIAALYGLSTVSPRRHPLG